MTCLLLLIESFCWQINLSGNRLCGVDLYSGEGTYTDVGIKAIADALSVCSSLTAINLANNDLGPELTEYISVSDVDGTSVTAGSKVLYNGKQMTVVEEVEDVVMFIELSSNLNAVTLMSMSINFKSEDAIVTHNNNAAVLDSTQTKVGLLKLNCNILKTK